MKRIVAGLTAALLAVAAGHAREAAAQSSAELAQTAALIAGLQNRDGGFAAQPGGPSSLGATTSAAKTLKYTGGSIPDVLACIAYIKACRDPGTGGFAPRPGAAPDVPTTASGLMGLAELNLNEPALIEPAVRYLSENAKSFEEVRIAVAGLEAVNATSPAFPAWEALVKQGANPDGTFGQGAALARDTGGHAAALLRMGRPLENRAAVVAALRAAQQPEGGWKKTEQGGPDLEPSYRIVRALFMLGEAPDLDRLKAFVASCRHDDGSYGLRAGDPGNGGTYYATILLHWARRLAGEPPFTETAGFTPLFNGKDLDGWEGEKTLWSARAGALVGTSPGLDHNEFLAHNGTFGSAVLKLSFRIKDGAGNSGVQFRSVRVPGHEMSGYQADLGEKYWGCLYDESRRNKVLVPASPEALKTLKPAGWNEYTIDARGPDFRVALNGVTSVQYHEPDPSIARQGRVAVQLHAGAPMVASFKDLRVQPLPEPTEDSTNAPGWHLRTSKGNVAGRKYALYVPKSHDGQSPLPVVLFLHGASARGDDGVKPTQSGLGPAILKNPDAFPVLAVFPQARETWKAGSADADAALATLEEVSREFKTAPKAVLTGLSMGGAGAWEIAAAHPDRFAAVIPVCGRASAESAPALSKMPVWAFVGDADRVETLNAGRAIVTALKTAGARPRYTEYRGVGHNSWDRAYNDPALVEWLLAKGRP